MKIPSEKSWDWRQVTFRNLFHFKAVRSLQFLELYGRLFIESKWIQPFCLWGDEVRCSVPGPMTASRSRCVLKSLLDCFVMSFHLARWTHLAIIVFLATFYWWYVERLSFFSTAIWSHLVDAGVFLRCWRHTERRFVSGGPSYYYHRVRVLLNSEKKG